jgi:hypothetical protein
MVSGSMLGAGTGSWQPRDAPLDKLRINAGRAIRSHSTRRRSARCVGGLAASSGSTQGGDKAPAGEAHAQRA